MEETKYTLDNIDKLKEDIKTEWKNIVVCIISALFIADSVGSACNVCHQEAIQAGTIFAVFPYIFIFGFTFFSLEAIMIYNLITRFKELIRLYKIKKNLLKATEFDNQSP